MMGKSAALAAPQWLALKLDSAARHTGAAAPVPTESSCTGDPTCRVSLILGWATILCMFLFWWGVQRFETQLRFVSCLRTIKVFSTPPPPSCEEVDLC